MTRSEHFDLACTRVKEMTKSGSVVVRPVALSDRAAWEPLWQGCNTFYRRSVEPEITDTTWSRFFDGYEPVHALVAERAGDLLGIVHYLFHRSTTMIGPTCYLQDLFTAEFARGQELDGP